MEINPQISVITVTFNNERTIKDCLDSILRFDPGVEIIVVDNGSKDQTLQIVKHFGKKVSLIEIGENLGFSKANNIGVKEACGKYLVFLNPDTRILTQGTFSKLQKVLEENHQYGLLGPKLIYPDQTIQPRARNLPTIWRAFQEYVLGVKGVYGFYELSCSALCEVESIIGACLIIDKDLFKKAGGFNEKYFMYYEDIELCKKVRGLGYKVGFVHDVTVEHAEGVSGKNQQTNYLMKASSKSYFGLGGYYFLELIFLYNRLINKIRKDLNLPAHI